ncbi:MAG: rhamnulose-1-phosphate aldolase [Oscillospiraceae bacterium]
MQDILTATFMTEMRKICRLMYDKGWDERNGGNISYMLEKDEVQKYIDTTKIKRRIKLQSPKQTLCGKIFIVTGTGKYFKNVYDDPQNNLGIIIVSDDGSEVGILWGYDDGGSPTSELSSHLLSHSVRLESDSNQRVIVHTHATNLIAMTFIMPVDDREFTRILWKMCTECLVVFPDGIGVLPWMVCGSDDIGFATADKMKDYRMVIWGQHGIFGAGSSIDEAFGLIETAEKAAEIYMKIAHLPLLQSITDEQLHLLEKAFNLKVREGFLD